MMAQFYEIADGVTWPDRVLGISMLLTMLFLGWRLTKAVLGI